MFFVTVFCVFLFVLLFKIMLFFVCFCQSGTLKTVNIGGPVVVYVTVLFISFQDGIYALGKAHMRSTPSLRRVPNVAFETVPVFAWLTMTLSSFPFKEDRLALPLSTPLSSRRSMLWYPWLCARTAQATSSSLQIFRDASHLCWLLCPPVCLIDHFMDIIMYIIIGPCGSFPLHSGMSRAVHPQEFSKVGVKHWHMPVWASHSTLYIL